MSEGGFLFFYFIIFVFKRRSQRAQLEACAKDRGGGGDVVGSVRYWDLFQHSA